MDLFIIINSGFTLLVFLVMHVVYLRGSDPSQVFGRLFSSFGFAGITPFVLGIIGYFSGMLTGYSFSLIIFSSVISWIFYAFLAFLYILVVFGIMESSVRISLLKEIYGDGDKGKTFDLIIRRYNKKTIIEKRLARFLQSGEVVKKSGYYLRGKKFTPYSLPDVIVQLIWKIYGGMEKA